MVIIENDYMLPLISMDESASIYMRCMIGTCVMAFQHATISIYPIAVI